MAQENRKGMEYGKIETKRRIHTSDIEKKIERTIKRGRTEKDRDNKIGIEWNAMK